MLALRAEQYQFREILRALRLCSWSPLAAMGADIRPTDLYRLSGDETTDDQTDGAPWSYEETMRSGLGLLDNIEAGS